MIATPISEPMVIHFRMADEALIRRLRLKSLKLTPTQLASKLGKRPSYYSDLMSKDEKSFGEKAARSIERGLELPPMWLDQPIDLSEAIPKTVLGGFHAPAAAAAPKVQPMSVGALARKMGEALKGLPETRRKTISILVAAQLAENSSEAELDDINALAGGIEVRLPALEDDERSELAKLREWHNALFAMAEHEPDPDRRVIAGFLSKVNDAQLEQAKASQAGNAARHPLNT